MNNLIKFLIHMKETYNWWNTAIDKSMKTLAEIQLHNQIQTLKTSYEKGNFNRTQLFYCARKAGIIR